MTFIQERLFDVSEMAVSMKAFVRAKLEGFPIRQAARAEKRKQQREKFRAGASETQECFGLVEFGDSA